jgi:putative addiction module component (TIGR02574 family)
MTDYYFVLSAACQLSQQDRLQLIDALWDTIPSEADAPFAEQRSREIQRQGAEYHTGAVLTASWTQLHDAAPAKVPGL